MRIDFFVASLLAPVVTGLASSFAPVVANAPQESILIFFMSLNIGEDCSVMNAPQESILIFSIQA